MSLELAQPPALRVLKEGYEAAHLPAVRCTDQEFPKEPDLLLLPPLTTPRHLRISTRVLGLIGSSDGV